jgi:hypothetical protein
MRGRPRWGRSTANQAEPGGGWRTLTEELGDLPGGEWVAQVPTHPGDDDVRRPTVAREGAAGGLGEVPMTGMAGEALTAEAVETIGVAAAGGRSGR